MTITERTVRDLVSRTTSEQRNATISNLLETQQENRKALKFIIKIKDGGNPGWYIQDDISYCKYPEMALRFPSRDVEVTE